MEDTLKFTFLSKQKLAFLHWQLDPTSKTPPTQLQPNGIEEVRATTCPSSDFLGLVQLVSKR
jgi:hypothetical protein